MMYAHFLGGAGVVSVVVATGAWKTSNNSMLFPKKHLCRKSNSRLLHSQ